MSKISSAFISIGSNIGEKYQNCIKSMELLNGLNSTRIIDVSNFYRTKPVDYTDQDWFINAVLKIQTKLTSFELINELQKIEQSLGQFKKNIRFGPRIIDLDIIFFNQDIIKTKYLIIPHPRMHKRNFVLKPLCDIEANIVHPILGITIKKLLKNIEKDNNQNIMRYKE
ncbi:MAG: 2-amino-4-hydroxy-6-hydroxymethyldihydropteridine diphosphokinase [Desulfobacteraceae bacterium 4572_130]|nr:MAG: 2-amino-4-hydroxy-6-hydroxymethyldihydropteridine diphosphokinase [Desulfobacteraceae bacterium 4572_130]